MNVKFLAQACAILVVACSGGMSIDAGLDAPDAIDVPITMDVTGDRGANPNPPDVIDRDMPNPDGQLPDGELPDGALPDGALPDGELPDGELPDGALPDGALPDAGVCPMGTTGCDGMVGCVDTQTDSANCGACGMACPMGQMCVAGACQAPPAINPGGPTFRIDSLTNQRCTSNDDHVLVTGNDRGGIALSASRVFYTGDDSTGAFDRQTLVGVAIGRIHDALIGDFRTQTAYVFADNTGTPITAGGGTADRLLELDPETGIAGTATMLSAPIAMAPNRTGLFSGWGRVVVLASDHAFNISLSSGVVTDMGAIAFPAVQRCASWAIWGTAEFFGNQLYVDYVRSSTTINRMAIPSGTITVLASFMDLADLCSFTASPWNNRWYWHHEGPSELAPMLADEHIGYCNATFTTDALQVNSLTTANCTSLEVLAATGDDRGGIALTNTQVLLSGDTATARFSAADLSGGVGIGQVLDAMFTDIGTGRAYTFTRGGVAVVNAAPGMVDGIRALDNNGTPVGAVTRMSRAVNIVGGSGIMSGSSRVVVTTGGRAIEVDIGSGGVSDIGAFVPQSPFTCEGWNGFYGIAELIDGQTWLTFVRGSNQIVRQLVGTSTIQIVAAFPNDGLSDMCSFTVSPSRDRWYFHYERGGFVGVRDETLGFCDAAVNRPASFRMNTLTANNCTVVDAEAVVSDDRGGLVTSLSKAFLTGDLTTGAFAIANLADGASVRQRFDSLTSDIATGQVYYFANERGEAINGSAAGPALLAQLIEIDGVGGGAFRIIHLSRPIPVTVGRGEISDVGLYSGWHRSVVHQGTNVDSVDLLTGVVTHVSSVLPQPPRTASENWAYWGVAEFFGGELYLSSVANNTTIHRVRVSDGTTSSVAMFMDLGDMASFTFAPHFNRWYFHYENVGQFGNQPEALGFCDATYSGAR